MSSRRLVFVDPDPNQIDLIFSRSTWKQLQHEFDVVVPAGQQLTESEIEPYLERVFAILGQTTMNADRLNRSPELKLIVNVEGNLRQNIDYELCRQRGIRVLNCSPVYGLPVAEMGLGLAIDLARGISREHSRFQAGTERYLASANYDSRLLTGAKVGLIGFGAIGRSLNALLQPFHCRVSVFDPWLPDAEILDHGAEPRTLQILLAESEFIFMTAAVTADNAGMLDAVALDLIRSGSFLILLSRAAVVDFEALTQRLSEGRFSAAIDVWPREPFDPKHPLRKLENVVCSPHRAGGIPQALHSIGAYALDDLRLVDRGLPPRRCLEVAPELAIRMKSAAGALGSIKT
ncbi:MAG: putative 2-hydroxyacid dehydrogenase YoaD [Nitrosomonadaceae bacterium]|nr:putative 2-hydroxyacid dehydrogenase YoaD [Nitrosomonadaceae bacterium]